MKRQNVLITILFVAAAGLRFADVFRPIDHASWRESDLGAVARNFSREGMNPFYPRIDWRGNGPGYAEMELPLYPWLTAITYKVFGEHDQIARIWAFLFSLGALFFFFRLAREYLSVFAATVAFAFFALNPLVVETATSIQPEGLMIFAYIAAVYFFLRWLKTDRNFYYLSTIAFTALSLLAKAPSAHIGLFFGVLLIEKFGWNVVLQTRVWLFGILSLLPAALWYLHAKRLWSVYGNSLGVSNEYHWIGWDFFTDSNFIAGIIRSEFIYVWLIFGLFVGAFAIWRGRREMVARHSLLWLACIFALYTLAARTTSEEWATYYHIFSIPPVALIFGLSIRELWRYMREFADRFSERPFALNLTRVAVCLIVIAAIFASLLMEAKQVRAGFLQRHSPDSSYAFAGKLRPELERSGPIVVSGSQCNDRKGYPIAYNSSFMFYWLDRKGWNTCIEHQSLEEIKQFEADGAVYLVAQKTYANATPGYERALREVYPVTMESADFVIFELKETN